MSMFVTVMLAIVCAWVLLPIVGFIVGLILVGLMNLISKILGL
jgi:phosphate/sulfate permease